MEIKLTKGLVAIIDPEDFERVSKYKWRANDNKSGNSASIYHARNDKVGYMHRFILNYTGDKVVDHINGNPLDNRKENLRIVSQKKNCNNRPWHRESVLPPPMPKRKTG